MKKMFDCGWLEFPTGGINRLVFVGSDVTKASESADQPSDKLPKKAEKDTRVTGQTKVAEAMTGLEKIAFAKVKEDIKAGVDRVFSNTANWGHAPKEYTAHIEVRAAIDRANNTSEVIEAVNAFEQAIHLQINQMDTRLEDILHNLHHPDKLAELLTAAPAPASEAAPSGAAGTKSGEAIAPMPALAATTETAPVAPTVAPALSGPEVARAPEKTKAQLLTKAFAKLKGKELNGANPKKEDAALVVKDAAITLNDKVKTGVRIRTLDGKEPVMARKGQDFPKDLRVAEPKIYKIGGVDFVKVTWMEGSGNTTAVKEGFMARQYLTLQPKVPEKPTEPAAPRKQFVPKAIETRTPLPLQLADIPPAPPPAVKAEKMPEFAADRFFVIKGIPEASATEFFNGRGIRNGDIVHAPNAWANEEKKTLITQSDGTSITNFPVTNLEPATDKNADARGAFIVRARELSPAGKAEKKAQLIATQMKSAYKLLAKGTKVDAITMSDPEIRQLLTAGKAKFDTRTAQAELSGSVAILLNPIPLRLQLPAQQVAIIGQGNGYIRIATKDGFEGNIPADSIKQETLARVTLPVNEKVAAARRKAVADAVIREYTQRETSAPAPTAVAAATPAPAPAPLPPPQELKLRPADPANALHIQSAAAEFKLVDKTKSA